MVHLGFLFLLPLLLLVGETSTTRDLNVCEQVQFLSNNKEETPNIILPWTPAGYQERQLIVKGGCAQSSSDYIWLTSEISIISVSSDGIIQPKRPGTAIIKAMSTSEPGNFDEIVVEVSTPPFMVMSQDQRPDLNPVVFKVIMVAYTILIFGSQLIWLAYLHKKIQIQEKQHHE